MLQDGVLHSASTELRLSVYDVNLLAKNFKKLTASDLIGSSSTTLGEVQRAARISLPLKNDSNTKLSRSIQQKQSYIVVESQVQMPVSHDHHRHTTTIVISCSGPRPPPHHRAGMVPR